MSALDDLRELEREWRRHVDLHGAGYLLIERLPCNSHIALAVRIYCNDVPKTVLDTEPRLWIGTVAEGLVRNAAAEVDAKVRELLDERYQQARGALREKAIAEARATLAELEPKPATNTGVSVPATVGEPLILG